MDYKKKYEEALERAKYLYGGLAVNDAKLEYIFPELAGEFGGEYKKDTAWLKKQKENIEKKYTFNYVFRPLAGTDIAKAAEQAIRRAEEGDHLVLAFNGAYIPVMKGDNVKDLVNIYYAYTEEECNKWIEQQKEQNVVPSRETILGIWELGNLWKENPEERDGLTQLQYIQKYWFAKCDYLKEQKPEDDWKEKRKKECPFSQTLDNNLYGCARYNGAIGICDGRCSWVVDYPKLKEIQDKKEQKPVNADYISGIREELIGIEDNVRNIDGLTDSQWVAIRAAHRLLGEYIEKEQKPAEWSKEDEINLTDAISAIEHLKNDCDWGYIGIGNDIDNVLNFLKSLPERLNLQSSWKPTEEQMKALKAVLVFAGKKDSPFTINQLHTIETLAMDLEKL